LFNYLKDGVEVFYSHAAFVGRLKQGLVSAGVDHTQFSAHSLRRGGASYAYEIGLSPLQIKQRLHGYQGVVNGTPHFQRFH
jgi:hypothetical protein